MRLNEILKAYQSQAEIQAFSQNLKKEGGHFAISGLSGSLPAFMLAALYRNTKHNTVAILNDKEEALYFLNDLQTLMPQKEILYFPASYKRPYEVEEIDNANVLQRAEVLNQLNHTESGRQLIVTFAEALFERVINKRALVNNTLEIRQGEKLGMQFLVEVLQEYGFIQEDFVYEPGTFAKRGGIIDIYSFAHELPYRVEFFGEEIESIRIFDPVDQTSVRTEKQLSLIPNIQKQLLDEQRVDFLSYISARTYLYVQNIELIAAELQKYYLRAEEKYEKLKADSGGGLLSSPPSGLYLNGAGFEEKIKLFTTVEFGKRQFFRQYDKILSWQSQPQPTFQKEFELLASHLKEQESNGNKLYLLSDNSQQLERIKEILEVTQSKPVFTPVQEILHAGFYDATMKHCLYTDHEIFGRYHRYKSKTSASRSMALTIKTLQELQPGDYVTHVTHGIGRFAGLHTIKLGEIEQEAAKIMFRDDDIVYVNVNQLYKISKYAGKDASPPRLSKLGSAEWSKAKARTKKRIKELAFDLISLYAKRKAQKGVAFSADSYLQQEMEASFPYVETPDQIKCINDVKQDMERDSPMDRLVCGDVGFGKTEIAIRAAFKAATDGKQTAVLVPTTILALQHYNTFKARLKGMPVEIGYISRFKTAKQSKETLKKLEKGEIDILIGTHRLISKDVKFKDLGLLVVDEEQKFGVNVKDKLKTIKVNVDTLTLTATPIPRTMQFSLLGVRDLSILNTPPPNRQPVETLVRTFDQKVIRDAIAYELKRGGQAFFVHNRIHELEELGALIKKLVPDARIAIAHGKLSAAKMEETMLGFIEGAYDVLLCTTIIESGLDIPNVNTIIINQAQHYGLSDLHQMRGRVGRSNRKAFCILLAPDESLLSRDAKRRLKAIEEFSDLGSGFHIALKDLDIRGSGDLLGAEQSGYINEVGYDLYHKILNETIQELKEEEFADVFQEELSKKEKSFVKDTHIETDLRALIPDAYIPNAATRLTFYNRIAAASEEEELRALSKEMVDRFGPVPEEVLSLLHLVRVRWKAKSIGFERIVLRSGLLRLYFPSDKTSEFYSSQRFAVILSWMQESAHKVKLKESSKYLSLHIQGVEAIRDISQQLLEISAYIEAQNAPISETSS